MAASIHPLERRSPRHGWSWTALVAETAGLGAVSVLEVRVRAAVAVPDGYRLVVQEYSQDPNQSAVPLASAQRDVSGAELGGGMSLQIFRNDNTASAQTYVVAWLEPGRADLEFDGLRAAPHHARWIAHDVTTLGRAQLMLHPAPRPRTVRRAKAAASRAA
jgi:hypothetical protein